MRWRVDLLLRVFYEMDHPSPERDHARGQMAAAGAALTGLGAVSLVASIPILVIGTQRKKAATARWLGSLSLAGASGTF